MASYSEIQEIVLENQPRNPKARANLMAVAKEAGVSAMTVSRVLNHPGQVAEATLEKVRAAVDALGYVPNLAANTLRRERSGVVVVMVPSIQHSIYSDTVQGISDVLEAAGYQLLLGCASFSPEKEEALVKAFMGHRPDGMILTGTLHTPTTRKLLSNAGIPVVELWDTAENHIDMAVGFDNFAAGYEIAKYVIGCGYTKLGYVGTNSEHETHENRAAQRSQGIYAAIEDAKLAAPLRDGVPNPLDMTRCGEIAADFVAAHPQMDAVICANEVIGVGAMVELQKRGWSIPDQIAVCGIGDANIAALASPGLTTVHFHGQRIGRRSAELMLARLNDPTSESGRFDIGFQIVPRGSTRSHSD